MCRIEFKNTFPGYHGFVIIISLCIGAIIIIVNCINYDYFIIMFDTTLSLCCFDF